MANPYWIGRDSIEPEVRKFPHELCTGVNMETFWLSSPPFITNAIKKTKCVPLTPPDEDNTNLSCLAAAQTPKGDKSEEI